MDFIKFASLRFSFKKKTKTPFSSGVDQEGLPPQSPLGKIRLQNWALRRTTGKHQNICCSTENFGISLWEFESWELDAPCDISEVETFVVDKSGQFPICCEQFFFSGRFYVEVKICGNSKLCFKVPLKQGLPPPKKKWMSPITHMYGIYIYHTYMNRLIFHGKNVGKYTSTTMDAKRVMSHAESARSFVRWRIRQDLSKSGTSWAGGILTTAP